MDEFKLTIELGKAYGFDMAARRTPWSLVISTDWAVAFNPCYAPKLITPPTVNAATVPPLHSAAWFRGHFFGTAHQRGHTYYPHRLATRDDLIQALAEALSYAQRGNDHD